MKLFALLAASCFAPAGAWQVLLHSDDNCKSSESYFIENVAGCKQPENMPADFDAKSVYILDVPEGTQVWAFTDNNLQCNHGEGASDLTYMSFSATGGGECYPLDSGKVGKWRIIQVD